MIRYSLHILTCSIRGRLRRHRAIRYGSRDWLACIGRPITVAECRAFRSELRRGVHPIERLAVERRTAQ